MDTEIKRRWVKALRSGNYKKGTIRLRTSRNEFCVLGVLCDVIDTKMWIKPNSNSMYKDCYMWNGRIGGIPTEVLMDIGMTMQFANEIAHMNDTPHPVKKNEFLYDFNYMADLIEREWE